MLATGKTITGRVWVYVRDDGPFGGPDPPAAVFHYFRDPRPVCYGQDHHVVAVATTNLHRFPDLTAELVHLVGGQVEKVEGPGIGETVMVKPRPQPERAVVPALQQVLGDEIVDNDVDGGLRAPIAFAIAYAPAGLPVSCR